MSTSFNADCSFPRSLTYIHDGFFLIGLNDDSLRSALTNWDGGKCGIG